MGIRDIPTISRIRRNHGLEHASLTILSQRFPDRRLAGYSVPGGFFLVGNLPSQAVREAVVQALSRMSNGEHQLAIHPNCGTNLLTSSLLAGVLAWLGMAGAKDKQERIQRLPLIIVLVTLGLITSRPLGPLVQKHVTTAGDPDGLSIVDIIPIQAGRFTLHRVITQG